MFVKELQKANFSNYDFPSFSCVDAACTDFLNKLIKVVIKIAPSKEIRIKNNTQEWFDREIAELIHAWEKLFLKFKKSKLHMKKFTKKLCIKFKILLGKRKENSKRLIFDKK